MVWYAALLQVVTFAPLIVVLQAIAGAIFNEHLLSSSAVSHLIRGAGSSIDLRSLRYINPPEVRNTLLHAATSGLKVEIIPYSQQRTVLIFSP